MCFCDQYSSSSRAVITSLRRGQLQIVPGHHQHRLVDVVDGVVAPRLIGRREDVDIALGLQRDRSRCRRCPVVAVCRRGRRLCRGGCAAWLAVVGCGRAPGQPSCGNSAISRSAVDRHVRRARRGRCRGRSPPARSWRHSMPSLAVIVDRAAVRQVDAAAPMPRAHGASAMRPARRRAATGGERDGHHCDARSGPAGRGR